MKDETSTWLSYADENFDVAELALEHGHLNSCLQNAQQAVEKYLKAVIVERDLEFRRTHSIWELVGLLLDQDIHVDISDDEMDLMDTIYVPSKYPVYSVLPQALPDPEICKNALKAAKKVRDSVYQVLKKDGTSSG
jgi:HEPN domain-containing protein